MEGMLVEYMKEAIKEAKEGIAKKHGGPFGTVIVKDGKIVGRGHNHVLVDHDPTAHGEVMAIRDAGKNLGTHDLSGCDLYTTAAPCPMCKGAILWANIKNTYYGCTIEDTDEIGFRDEVFYKNWNSSGDNYGEIIDREACKELFKEYINMEHDLY